MSAQRGQLAISLESSLRQLGTAHTELQKKAGRAQRAEPSPGAWGLLQELQALQLKCSEPLQS